MPVRWPASQGSKQELKNNYQGFDMSPDRTVIHVLFFVGKSGQPTVLPLTDAYEVVVHPSLNPDKKKPIALEINPSSSASAPGMLQVASFTALYGDNGCGKTEMLLGLCEGLTDWRPQSKVGMLWENQQGLQLSCGATFEESDLRSDLTIHRDPTVLVPDFSTVFYTTSPFERVRRGRLRRRGVKDVSPRFGKDVESELVAAFNAYPYLKGRVDFVGKAQVELKLKPFSLLELVTDYGRSKLTNYESSDSVLKKHIQNMDRNSLPEIKFILSFAILNCVDRISGLDANELIDDLLEMIQTHDTDLNFLLYNPPTLDDRLTENALLAQQLAKASHALSVIQLLFEDINSWRRNSSLAHLDEKVGHHIREHGKLIGEVSDLGLLQFSFKQLSSGQASMMSLYCSTARAFGEFERESQDRLMLLCIDEGEMFMHPKWQRMYIDSLLKFIGQFGSLAKRTHVFISTHSLIVAADTPAGRLFDLDNQQLTNAFGYTPKQTLNSVFAVGDFTGEFNLNLLTKLSDVLNRKDQDLESIRHAWQIADTLANDELRHHVQQQLSVLIGGPHAQA
ncbi:ATP-binding protein [Pseudomonas protegens]|uniref:ATP-binding protein n=1 Tax=Pseudomonas protegens TaxID=380021 RepID=UPI0021CAB7BB|nr:ATP-binding protein [Pseudomonas protegens]MCU1769309.1 ATP-binding protein [Pseudomonas protegens]